MDFNIFGIGKGNSPINGKEDKQNEKYFGIRKGEKLGPLPKDMLAFSSVSPEQDLEETIQRLAKNCHGSKEIFSSTISTVAKRGTENSPELLAKRIETLKKFENGDISLLQDIMFLEFTKKANTSFLLDNLDEIKRIFEEKEVSDRSFCMGTKEVLQVITPENYSTFIECAKNEKFMGEDFAALVMYKAKPHHIEFGKETAIVDSSEILSLISSQQSLSTIRENCYDKFEATVNSLIPKDYNKNDQQYYYKIAEGILSQKPELAKIATDYRNFAKQFQGKNLSKQEYTDAMEMFFISLEEKGTLPKEIELRTIVPDENALLEPSSTLKLFLEGETVSKMN